MTIKNSVFEDERLAQEIAEYMAGNGTQNTYSGSYFYSFAEINHIFGTSLPDDEDMVYLIADEIESISNAAVDITGGFDLIF